MLKKKKEKVEQSSAYVGTLAACLSRIAAKEAFQRKPSCVTASSTCSYLLLVEFQDFLTTKYG